MSAYYSRIRSALDRRDAPTLTSWVVVATILISLVTMLRLQSRTAPPTPISGADSNLNAAADAAALFSGGSSQRGLEGRGSTCECPDGSQSADNVVIARGSHRRRDAALSTDVDSSTSSSGGIEGSSYGEDETTRMGSDGKPRADESGDAHSDSAAIRGGGKRKRDKRQADEAAAKDLPTILILTPVKNAGRHLEGYFRNLRSLSYPKSRISLGLMDSDSDDTPSASIIAKLTASRESNSRINRVLTHYLKNASSRVNSSSSSGGGAMKRAHADDATPRLTGTMGKLLVELPKLSEEFRRVTIFQHDFGLSLSRADRHSEAMQLQRRALLARSRNHLLSTALRDEEWVLWCVELWFRVSL